jgi:hypothetical protein
MNVSIHDENQPGGGGRDGFAGYEYQMDVSVWLALDLLLANKQAHELILEPATYEDLEAELEEYEPGRATERFQVGNYLLVVQAKLRSRDVWTAAGIKALLNHGSDQRASAARRLADPNVRYLLVTSAPLNREARGLGVRNPGVWPKPSEMPASILTALSHDAAGRVAVIGGEDEERLTSDIKRLLVDAFRVPNALWENCLKALREEARIRMKGIAEGVWCREDLEHVIRQHEGYLASSPEIENYVKPTNWPDLLQAMRDKHAALIIGQSGTGKTLATEVLYQDLRREIPGLKRVKIAGGPSQLRDDQTLSPVLFDIEDPWGRFDFDEERRSWNDQLDKFFANARHDRMIVATTRRDVADSARVLKTMRPWLVPLEAEHYGDAQRARLYRTRIPALPWELRLPMGKAEGTVLAALATPLEIQKFFDAVPTLDRKHLSDEAFVAEAIRRAHENSIERTVVEQIEHRHDICAATVIWALLKVADKFSLSRLRALEEELAGRDDALSRGVVPLVQFFVAARNLRQKEDSIAYYHPRVEAAIEQALRGDRLTAAKTLGLLISIWVSIDGETEQGAGMAAKLLAAIPNGSRINVRLNSEIAGVVDTWLEARLAEPGRKLEEELRLAAAGGSKASGLSEVARYLLHREDRRFNFSLDHWWKPERNEAWYSNHGSDPATRPLVERFIREVLPFSHGRYGKNFARDVKRLVPEITGAFLDAAHRIVGLGVTNSDDAIAEGALDDLAGFDAVLEEAFQELTPTEEEKAKKQALRLALVNGEYSDEYAEHIQDDEDGYTAGEFLKAYIRRVRSTVGWKNLASHVHHDRLRPYWLRELLDEVRDKNRDLDDSDPEQPTTTIHPDEIEGVFACAYDTEDEDDLWYVLNLVWEDRYLSSLLGRVRKGHPSSKIRLAATTCLIERGSTQLQRLWNELLSAGETFRLVEIALDLAHLRHKKAGDWRDHRPAASAAMSLLPQPFLEMGEAYLEILNDRSRTVSEETRHMFDAIQERTEDIRRLRLAITVPGGPCWQDDSEWLLSNAEDPDIAVEALRAAEKAELADVLDRSLNHKFADARAEALRAVARKLVAPLPASILDMVSDKGKSVRMALGALLDTKIDPAHMPTLLRLARDNYSTGSHYENNNAVLPIARNALDAIKKYGPLTREDAEELKGIAISTDDPILRAKIFDLLATSGDSFGQELLFDLATMPGRYSVRRLAAAGLLSAVAPETVAKITSELLALQIASVAAIFSIILGAKGGASEVKAAAEQLTANPNRRALVVLLIRFAYDRDPGRAEGLAMMLPENHPALKWALGGEIDWKNDRQLSDLGDPATCSEVFRYMKS